MIKSFPCLRRLPAAGSVLSLAQLDELLDVPTAAFDRCAEGLAKAVATRGVRIQIPPPALDGLRAIDPRTAWTTYYEAQVQRLPRLERADEFAMARRYEFLTRRLRAALDALGVTADAIVAATKPPRDLSDAELAALPRRPRRLARRTPARDRLAHQHVRGALDELLALRSLYVEGSLYMVFGTAHRYRGLGVDLIDLVQEGNASLFQAIEGFDWRRDVRFRTYAQFWIQQAVLKTLYNASRTVRLPIWVQKTLKKVQRLRQKGTDESGVPPSNEAIAAHLDMPVSRLEELLAVRRYAVSIDAERPQQEGRSLAQEIRDDSIEPIEDTIVEDDLVGRMGEAMADLPEREQMILRRRFGLGGGDIETLGDIAVDLGVSAERVRQLQNAAIERLRKPQKLALFKAFAG